MGGHRRRHRNFNRSKHHRKNSFDFKRWWYGLSFDMKGLIVISIIGIAYVSISAGKFALVDWFTGYFTYWGLIFDYLSGALVLFGFGLLLRFLVSAWAYTILTYFLIKVVYHKIFD